MTTNLSASLLIKKASESSDLNMLSISKTVVAETTSDY